MLFTTTSSDLSPMMMQTGLWATVEDENAGRNADRLLRKFTTASQLDLSLGNLPRNAGVVSKNIRENSMCGYDLLIEKGIITVVGKRLSSSCASSGGSTEGSSSFRTGATTTGSQSGCCSGSGFRKYRVEIKSDGVYVVEEQETMVRTFSQ